MKGNNTLRINQATMIEALQQYFDAQFKTHHKVSSVKCATLTSAYSNEYDVDFEDESQCQP